MGGSCTPGRDLGWGVPECCVRRAEPIVPKKVPIMLHVCCTASYYAQQMPLLCSNYAHLI